MCVVVLQVVPFLEGEYTVEDFREDLAAKVGGGRCKFCAAGGGGGLCVGLWYWAIGP